MGSLHNELTGRSGFISRAIRNALQIEDAEKGIERLSESLTPIIDLWSQPEWALLRGERLWGASPSQTAVAAELSSVGILNPTGSGMIVVVDALWVAQNNNVQVGVGVQQAFTASSTPNVRDSRIHLLTGLQTIAFANHQVAPIFSAFDAQLVTPGATFYPVAHVLSPGFFLAVQGANVNTATQVNFVGRERPAFAGELTARG